MRKTFLLTIILLIIPLAAFAELSTNLKTKKVMLGNSTYLVERTTFVDAEGNPVVPSDKGYATLRNVYQGRVVIREECLDENGVLVNCTDGYAYKTNRYKGRTLIGSAYYDVDGKLVNGPDGYARQVITYEGRQHQSTWNYDADGNPVGTHHITEFIPYQKLKLVASDSWYDADNQLTPGPKGYARVEYKYDGRTRIGISYLSADGTPFYLKSAGYAKMDSVYQNGKPVTVSYYGKDNELIAGPDGYARVQYDYRNNYETETYYNADGTLFYNEIGVCGVSRKKQDSRTVEEYYYLTGEGVRGSCIAGYSGTKINYNIRGEIATQSYYDENDRLVVVEELGYAQVRNTYTRSRYLTRTEYYGANGKPIRSAGGYAVERNIYNKKDLVETRYYDVDKKTLINCAKGYARVLYQCENGNITDQRFYTADGERFVNAEGYDEVRNKWSGKKITEETYWRNGEPVISTSGFHMLRAEYSHSGKETKRAYYNTEGQLTLCAEGYTATETEYNSSGGVMAKKYFGTDGQLINTPGKEYAYMRTILLRDASDIFQPEEEDEDEADTDEEELTDHGEPAEDDGEENDSVNTTIVEYHGLDGKLMMITSGYAYLIREKTAEGFVASEDYYDDSGNPVIIGAGYARVEKEYDSAGNAITERYFGTDGEKLACKYGYDEIRREYNEEKQAIRTTYYQNGEKAFSSNGYAVMTREYDEKGLVAVERYYGKEGEPVYSSSGYHRIDRVWKDNGQATSEAWFDTEDRPVNPNNNTYVRREKDYDEEGNVVAERYYGPDNARIACRDGYDEVRKVFNEYGQAVRTSYYLDGERALTEKGYAILVQEYDHMGFVATESYFGTNEEPLLNKTGYHTIRRTWADKSHPSSEAWFDTEERPLTLNNTYVRREREYDGAWNITTERYYGPDGAKIACKDGYDEIRKKYNEKKQAVRTEYYLNGERTIIPKGYAVLVQDYDDDGLVTAESYYGISGEPVLSQAGYHTVKRTWMDKNHATSEAWFDTADKPMTLNNTTYVKRERDYDESGNVTAERYYGPDGEKTACGDGYDETRKVFNDRNLAIKTEYLLNGERVVITKGYAVITQEYDEAGLVASESYFGINEEPVVSASGYHTIKRTWQDKNHATSEAWFDTEDQPMAMNGNTYVRREREYDEAGNVTVERYYGPDGEKTACSDGYDEIRKVYNDRKLAVKTEYRLNGDRFTIQKGYAILVQEYDEAGLVATESYFGTNEEPVVSASGYHTIKRTWQDKNHATSEAWFDTEDRPMYMNGNTYVRREREYDEAGNVAVERYYGPDGEKTACSDGYDEIRKVYNDQKQAVRTEYYTDGKLMTIAKGYAILVQEYDEAGLVASESYFGTSEEPVINASGYHMIKRTWQDKNHATSEAWFDKEDRPMAMNGNTYVRREREYDEAGNVAAERYYGPDGEKTACSDGYDEIRKVYNDRKQAVKTEYYLNGERITLTKGYAVMLREYDEAGNVTVEQYYGPDGEKAACSDGYDEIRKVYNDRKQAERTAYYKDGKLMTIAKGYAVLVQEYDEAGLVASESYFGTNEDPVINASGYHTVKRTWQDKNHATSEAWFDTEDRPMYMNGNTYVRREREYDETGNIAVERYYGPEGEKTACSDGYDEIRKTYNDKKQAVRTVYYSDGKLMAVVKGYAILVREYDEAGLVASESYFGINEEPVVSASGYHTIKRTWQDKNHATSEAWFDTEDRPMTLNGNTYVRREREYDEAGNVAVERYYGPDGEKTACSDGYDEIRKTYNDKKQAVRTEYYTGGKLTVIAKGYAILIQEYDEAGFVATESYFGTNEEPVINASGYHTIKRTWQDKNHATSEAWFDTEDRPMALNGNTYVRREREYDEAGNVSAERYYGPEGEKTACSDGYDEIRKVYNDRKQAVRTEYYLNGERTMLPKGYAVMLRKYDEAGLVAVESYFGVSDEPVLNQTGYHTIKRIWADKNHISSEAWFDTEDQPMPIGDDTYVRRERDFDAAGNIIAERYFDANDLPTACRDGYDEKRMSDGVTKYYLNGTEYIPPEEENAA